MPRRCRACPCCPPRPRALSRPGSSTCTSFKQSPPRNEAGGGRQSAGLRASGASRKQAPVQQLRDLCCREEISTRTPLQRLVDNPGHWPLRNISQPSRGQVRQQVCPEDRSAQTLQWSCRKHVSRPQTQDEVHKKVGGGAFATANLDACKLLALGCVEPSGCNRSFTIFQSSLGSPQAYCSSYMDLDYPASVCEWKDNVEHSVAEVSWNGPQSSANLARL